MKYFKNITTAIFLAIFGAMIFASTKPVKSQNEYLHVKSNLVFDQKFSGKVFVIDGDSIRVGKNEVRLFGIDAPEFKQNCFNAQNEEYACGRASFDFLRKLAGGKFAECVYAQKDKYDRYLGKCLVDDVSINEEIIKNGMAVIYNFTESDKKIDALEAEAKEKKLGIWQGVFQLPKNYRKENKHNN